MPCIFMEFCDFKLSSNFPFSMTPKTNTKVRVITAIISDNFYFTS